MRIQSVGVLGCGQMGSGIVEVVARAGYKVDVHEVSADALEAGRMRIERSLAVAVEREKVTDEERDLALHRIGFTERLEDLAVHDLIIEAVVEDLDVKKSLFRELDGLCPPHTILASNTSSLTISEMAASVERSDRLLGLHFFNPVPVMKLVEIVRTLATSDEVLEVSEAFIRTLGKRPVLVMDGSGFIVNLLLIPYLLDAVRQLERGIASMEDMDTAMALGCGHPMGPFSLMDLVGIDTTVRVADIMFDEYRSERYAAPPLLRRMVLFGRHGRKTERGFYDYSGDSPVPLQL